MSRATRRGSLGAGIALLVVLWASGAGHAQGRAAEYELKAAFLYNFAKFVEWPTESGTAGPVCLGVLEPDPFGDVLDRMLAGKTVHDRPIAIRRFGSLDAVGSCHVLFVSAGAARTLSPGSWTRPGVLTVGEDEAFVERGGLIAFAMEGNKLRFVVNGAAAEHAGLKLSSQLLKLAVRVRTEGR